MEPIEQSVQRLRAALRHDGLRGDTGTKNKLLRVGIYLFAAMEWVSAVGFRMFPLSDSGYAGAWQDQMHLITTALVVALSITSLLVIIIAGVKELSCRSYAASVPGSHWP